MFLRVDLMVVMVETVGVLFCRLDQASTSSEAFVPNNGLSR